MSYSSKAISVLTIIAAISVSVGECNAADINSTEQTKAQTHSAKIYGSELMTDKERQDFHSKMNSFKSQEERDAYMEQHRKLIQERAAEKGVSMPNNNTMGQGTMGQGAMGQGAMGQGGRMR